MKLRCYACGKELGQRFWLVSEGYDVDRVFLMGECCIKRADSPQVKVPVERRK